MASIYNRPKRGEFFGSLAFVAFVAFTTSAVGSEESSLHLIKSVMDRTEVTIGHPSDVSTEICAAVSESEAASIYGKYGFGAMRFEGADLVLRLAIHPSGQKVFIFSIALSPLSEKALAIRFDTSMKCRAEVATYSL